MITIELTKDELLAIETQLKQEVELIKESKNSATRTANPVIKSKLEMITAKHQQHFDKLISLLK